MSSIGEQRVRVDFNVSNSEHVGEFKVKTAVLINILQAYKNDEVSKTYDKDEAALQALSGEKLRLIALAQTAYEEACMWAVKAVTI